MSELNPKNPYNLPPYSGNTKCAKCGNRVWYTTKRFRSVTHRCVTDKDVEKYGRENVDCLVRTCRDCNYEWEELPLDRCPAPAITQQRRGWLSLIFGGSS